MLDGNHTFTPAGRIHKPDLSQICQQILDSWNSISPDTIRRSFLIFCITNALDGTEDDILWQEIDESDPFADDDEVESIVDEEGELFYAREDEVSVLDVNEQEYRDIFIKMTLMKVILLDFNVNTLQRYDSFHLCLYIRCTNLPLIYSVYKMLAKKFWFTV